MVQLLRLRGSCSFGGGCGRGHLGAAGNRWDLGREPCAGDAYGEVGRQHWSSNGMEFVEQVGLSGIGCTVYG